MTSSSFLFFAAFDAKTSLPRKRTNPRNSDSVRKMQSALQAPLGRKHHGDRPFTPKKRGGIGRVPISENRFRQQKRSFRLRESSFVICYAAGVVGRSMGRPNIAPLLNQAHNPLKFSIAVGSFYFGDVPRTVSAQNLYLLHAISPEQFQRFRANSFTGHRNGDRRRTPHGRGAADPAQ